MTEPPAGDERPADAGLADARLAGRRIVVGVSGGIAAYKAVEICRRLVDAGAHVMPVLTQDAARFIGPVTLSALASEPVRMSLYDEREPIPHTMLGQTADLIIVAPATAKVLGKLTAGISDDLLTATLLATRAPVLVAPAMHTEMWEHAAVQHNIEVLASRGVQIIAPEEGRLAGGDVGRGRLADPAIIVEAAARLLDSRAGDLAGIRVLVTAGGTREPIDPVRFIGNRSSGKMGTAVAEAAAARGAAVVLVTTVDHGDAARRQGVEIVRVETAQQMHDVVTSRFDAVDVVVMAAAVADFRPIEVAAEKIKKRETGDAPLIALERTPDILAALGHRKSGHVLVGFAAETERVREHAVAKLTAKRVDLMVANDVSAHDAGFEVETNRVIIFGADGTVEEVPLMAKRAVADRILDRVVPLLARR